MQKTWFDPWVRKIPWTRKWQPTPVCLPGDSHGQRSLEGYSPWGCKESDMTEWLSLWASLVAQLVNNLPTRQETWVRFLDWENRLEKEMATHSSMLAWGIPWTEEPGRLQSVGSQESETTLRLNHHHNLLELSGFFSPLSLLPFFFLSLSLTSTNSGIFYSVGFNSL